MMNALDYRKKQEKAVCAMILDIDYFKDVNDRFGHSTGDHTLKRFAQILLDYVREKNATVGRWGGEEFVVVCYGRDCIRTL